MQQVPRAGSLQLLKHVGQGIAVVRLGWPPATRCRCQVRRRRGRRCRRVRSGAARTACPCVHLNHHGAGSEGRTLERGRLPAPPQRAWRWPGWAGAGPRPRPCGAECWLCVITSRIVAAQENARTTLSDSSAKRMPLACRPCPGAASGATKSLPSRHRGVGGTCHHPRAAGHGEQFGHVERLQTQATRDRGAEHGLQPAVRTELARALCCSCRCRFLARPWQLLQAGSA